MDRMEALEIIRQRRSIRSYQPQQISEEDLNTLLRILVEGPTARNMQKIHFSVVQDAELIDFIAEKVRQNMLNCGNPEQIEKAKNPEYSPLFHAPTVIFISGDLSGFNAHTDCGIAAGLLVASASLLGISSCITASSIFLFKEEEGKKVLQRMGVPENYNVVCGVALGYQKGEKPAMPPKRKDLVTFVR